jgi:hypothetical protein
MQNAKHHEGEKCHRGTCETIRLPDRETGGEYHRVHQSVSLSDHCMPNHAKTVHQELTVKQKDLHFRVEQGDCHHHADNIEVDLELKSFEMRGGKTHVHVGAPKVHFEEQKVTFEVVEGKKKEDQIKVNVCVKKGHCHVTPGECVVTSDKCHSVYAPDPIICVRHVKECPPCDNESSSSEEGCDDKKHKKRHHHHKGHHATGFQAVAKPATKAARKPATKPAALVAKPATKAARKPATKPAAKRGRR